jgi:hypothetical protein
MTATDNAVFDQLTLLAACLCTQITADGLPETCFCGIIPGDAASFDYTGDCTKRCGMAWVRMSGVYPASGVGVPNEEVKNCGSALGFETEVGIMRCTPVGTGDKPPTTTELLTSTNLQVADMLTMRRAIYCCRGSDDWILGTYTPIGPTGGMLGGTWTLTMWVP